MYQLIESIKVEKQLFQNLFWHQKRMNIAMRNLFGIEDNFALSEKLNIPQNIGNDTFKCRIIYDVDIKKIEFIAYVPQKIQSLKLIYDDEIDYSYKFEDRGKINNLFFRKENCDDILIIKNGFVTDTSFCNIVFFDGKHWITPSTPLLKGTKREKLLSEKRIKENPIYWDDIKCFKKACLINAFFEIDNDLTTFPIKNII